MDTNTVTSSSSSSLHNDYLLRSVLSAFSRSNFDECAGHIRAIDEPLINFIRQLPIDAFIARFPSSRQLLETVYFRLSVSPSVFNPYNELLLSKEDVKLLHCTSAVKEVINYIADAQDRCGNFDLTPHSELII